MYPSSPADVSGYLTQRTASVRQQKSIAGSVLSVISPTVGVLPLSTTVRKISLKVRCDFRRRLCVIGDFPSDVLG